MIAALFRGLLGFGLAVTVGFVFFSLMLAMAVGYRLGRLTVIKRSTKSEDRAASPR
jgi:hypothetical protein